MPKVPEKTSNFGLRIPENEPFIQSRFGVKIYNGKPHEARVFLNICERVNIWENKGPIDVPLEDQMRVPLVDGWQSMSGLLNRPYPVSRKDKDFIDEKYKDIYK